MNVELHQVRDEIRKVDEELVRELTAPGAGDRWESRPVVARRIALGVRVAECKFGHEPARYRPLAKARDEQGLARAITDARTEAAVLERVRKQVLDLGGDPGAAQRMADFYRDWIIPETKNVQIRRLCELGCGPV